MQERIYKIIFIDKNLSSVFKNIKIIVVFEFIILIFLIIYH